MRILCVCLSATIQRTICFDSLTPGAVNRSQNWREDASGKAVNAARVLNQLEPGSAVALCPVGNANAERFLKLASADSDLYITPICIEGNTRECWTLLNARQGTTTEIISDEAHNPAHIAGAEAELRLLESVRDYMASFDALLLAGSRPAAWSANICARICDAAHKAGKLILADFTGDDLLGTLKVCTPDIIKINEEEFRRTFAIAGNEEEELSAEITKKSAALHNSIVVTRGKKETLAAHDGSFVRVPAEIVAPVNTTACGDSFSAGFLHEILRGGDSASAFESALRAGTHAAALNAQTLVPGSITQKPAL